MTKRVRMLASAALLALHISACAGDDDPAADAEGSSAAQLEACDPLHGEERPITLGKVIAVGRDADGVLYVLVDPQNGEYQVFVSEHGALQRHRVLGSGSGDEMWITVSVEADPEFGLYVQLDSDHVTSIRRFDPAVVTDKNKVPEGDDLDVLSESDLDDLKVRNLPPEVTIEYLGKFEDDRRVLVVRPSDDWGYEDFRVFLGAPQKMLERDVQNVTRALDGGSTNIDFTLDGKPATLDFPIEFVDDHFTHGDSTLQSQGKTLSITLENEPNAHAVGGLRFFCR